MAYRIIKNEDEDNLVSVKEEYASGSECRPEQILAKGESTEIYLQRNTQIIITEYNKPLNVSPEVEELVQFAKKILKTHDPDSLRRHKDDR
jgi:hypothetical protein